MRTFYLIVADLILILHFLLVFVNVAALPVIWIGHFRGWNFVRSFCFRVAHLGLIAFVAAESVLGVICPLTTWENSLRQAAGTEAHYAGGFIAHWVRQLLFFDCDERIFTAGYITFFLLVALTWFWIRPRPSQMVARAQTVTQAAGLLCRRRQPASFAHGPRDVPARSTCRRKRRRENPTFSAQSSPLRPETGRGPGSH